MKCDRTDHTQKHAHGSLGLEVGMRVRMRDYNDLNLDPVVAWAHNLSCRDTQDTPLASR